MTGATFLHSMAVQLAWQSGQGHGTNGMLAILFCLRNRVAAGHDGGDLGKIVQREHYILEVKDPESSFEVPDIREPSFSQLLGYVEGVFDNSVVDRLTSGALYWGDLPSGAQRVAQVGTLHLWR